MSTDTPTPRTDAMYRPIVYDCEGKPYQAPFVMEHKAAELERELTAANARHAALIKRLEELAKRCEGFVSTDHAISAQCKVFAAHLRAIIDEARKQ